MKIDQQNNIIQLNGKEIGFSAAIEKLSRLSSAQTADFFQSRERKLSRKLNMQALRYALNDKVKIAKQLNISDEMKYRLLCYPTFCEYQLQNFMNTIITDELFKEYKEYFWKLVLANSDDLKIADSELNYLLLLPEQSENIDFKIFQETIFPVVFDDMFEFDGLTKEQFRVTLAKSSTLVELREIGDKYKLSIPRRLKKEELQAIIVEELQAMGKYDEETAKKLNIMSVLTMQRFAKQNKIKASIELKKEELIEYILKQADKANLTKNDNSFVVKEIELVEAFEFKEEYVVEEEIEESVVEETIEEVTEEPVVEETIEEVIEEPVVEETIEEVIEEPVVEETIEEVIEEPVVEETIEEVIEEPAKVVEVIREVTTVGVASIDPETIKTIIKETVLEIMDATKPNQVQNEPITKEIIKEIVSEIIENTKPAEVIQNEPITKEVIKEIVSEIVESTRPVEVNQLNTNEVISQTVEQVVYRLSDKLTPVTKIIQVPAQGSTQAISQIDDEISSYDNFDNQRSYADVPDYENKMFDQNIANNMQENDVKVFKNASRSNEVITKPIVEDVVIAKPVVNNVSTKEEKLDITKPISNKKNKDESSYEKKMVKRIKKIRKGKILPNEQDMIYLERQNEVLAYVDLNQRIKMRNKKMPIIFKILLFILIIALLILVVYAVDGITYQYGKYEIPWLHKFLNDNKDKPVFNVYEWISSKCYELLKNIIKK